jgi:hypothetical protein
MENFTNSPLTMDELFVLLQRLPNEAEVVSLNSPHRVWNSANDVAFVIGKNVTAAILASKLLNWIGKTVSGDSGELIINPDTRVWVLTGAVYSPVLSIHPLKFMGP